MSLFLRVTTTSCHSGEITTPHIHPAAAASSRSPASRTGPLRPWSRTQLEWVGSRADVMCTRVSVHMFVHGADKKASISAPVLVCLDMAAVTGQRLAAELH